MKSYKFDARTLFSLNILFSIFVFFIQSRKLNHLCIITALILMLLSGLYKKTLKFSLSYLIVLTLQNYVSFFNNQNLKVFIGMVFYIWTNLLPLLIIGSIMINTVKTNEFISILEKMKISRNFIIALAVAFRYVPTIREEFKKIRENMKLRGINSNISAFCLQPIKTFEYIIVPLLFRSIKIAEELTLSAITRGVEYEKERSSFYDVSMKKIDYTILILFFTALITFIVLLQFEKVRR